MTIFAYVPSTQSLIARPRVLKAQFGDGYAQRMADGLNARVATYSVAFNHKANATAQAIAAFLDARGGHEWFYWTPVGGAQGKYVCASWSVQPVTDKLTSVTAEFEQVFDP